MSFRLALTWHLILRAKSEAVMKRLPLQGGNYGTSPYAFSPRLGLGMMKLLPDVPTAIVVIHLVALAVLLIHVGVTP